MKWLITGGAGFIGCNVAARLVREGCDVIIYDNLHRRGAEENFRWLQSLGKCDIVTGDIRDFSQLTGVFRMHRGIDVVLHLAAQVAVTTSVLDPRRDFEINALGTFNILEALRQFAPNATLLNASTNKVYGAMENVRVALNNGRYQYLDMPCGIGESQPLDFHSPYGCSKGTGDQYVKDYAAIYGLKTANFRQSCIYGPRQFGIEDQGWIAWFAIAGVRNRPITIYGDGKQVRDILYIDDLVDCYLKTVEHIDVASGQSYNIGGGPENAVSLLEVIRMLEELFETKLQLFYSGWRPGDQRMFMSDISKAKADLGWEPKIGKNEGIKRLVDWVVSNRSLFV